MPKEVSASYILLGEGPAGAGQARRAATEAHFKERRVAESCEKEGRRAGRRGGQQRGLYNFRESGGGLVHAPSLIHGHCNASSRVVHNWMTQSRKQNLPSVSRIGGVSELLARARILNP